MDMHETKQGAGSEVGQEAAGNGQAMSPEDYESALRRMHEVTGTKTQAELAEIFGIRQSSVSDAKRRGTIPAEWLIKLLDYFSIAPHYVRTGEGLPYLVPSECRTAAASPPKPPRLQAKAAYMQAKADLAKARVECAQAKVFSGSQTFPAKHLDLGEVNADPTVPESDFQTQEAQS